MSAPILYRWEGDVFRPLPRHAKECDEQFVVGKVYILEDQQDRSDASHRHFFAEINAAWENLPEPLAALHPSPEHLRKAVLIRAGWCDLRQITCGSKAEALRLSTLAKSMDPYALVSINGPVVSIFTARSQSFSRMKKADFQAIKDKVLTILSGMIGVTPQALAANAA